MKKHEYEIGDGRSFEIVHLSQGEEFSEGRIVFSGPAVIWIEIFADGERVPIKIRGPKARLGSYERETG